MIGLIATGGRAGPDNLQLLQQAAYCVMSEVCAGKPQEPWLLPAAWAATMACLDALSRPADRQLLLKCLAGSALPFSSSSFNVTIR